MGRGWSGAGCPAEAGGGDEVRSPVRLGVVEDHPLLRAGLRAVLSAERGFEWVGEWGDGRVALEGMRRVQPDLAIVDVSLPGGQDGLELIKGIHAELPEVRVLVLSVHDEALYALRAISAGARGYLMKDAAPEKLLSALDAIRRGEVAVSEAVSQRLVRRAVGCRQAGQGGVQKLSDRELEVLAWMGKGISTRQIAHVLRISPKTVETHRVNLKRKLALESAPELLRYALAWRLKQDHGMDGEGSAGRFCEGRGWREGPGDACFSAPAPGPGSE